MEKDSPFTGQTIFVALRNVLAELYPIDQDARRVVDEARLIAIQIAFSPHPQTNWHNILAEAVHQNRLDALLSIVFTSYGDNSRLRDVYVDYRRLMEQGGQLDAPSPMLEGGSVAQLIKTSGGMYVEGNVTTGSGDVVGRDKIIHGDEVRGDKIVYIGDQAYDVRGLENPYLGLKAFTYDERDCYAGRGADVTDALTRLVRPGSEHTFLFIIGASGSGKSSFAQAGLLPALEAHYQQLQYTIRWAVFRPGEKPLAGLATALRTLNLPAEGVFAVASMYQLALPPYPTDPNQISVLVIDQFEEFFSQSDAPQRDTIFALLTALPAFRELRMHIIATMRADYLPDLFAYETLYNEAKTGIDLRVMNKVQLKEAIQRPLLAKHPTMGKRFQDALLNALTQDAGEDAAYLPLLQVTLDDLWSTGQLTVDHYSSLTEAIGKRADEIYIYNLWC